MSSSPRYLVFLMSLLLKCLASRYLYQTLLIASNVLSKAGGKILMLCDEFFRHVSIGDMNVSLLSMTGVSDTDGKAYGEQELSGEEPGGRRDPRLYLHHLF